MGRFFFSIDETIPCLYYEGKEPEEGDKLRKRTRGRWHEEDQGMRPDEVIGADGEIQSKQELLPLWPEKAEGREGRQKKGKRKGHIFFLFEKISEERSVEAGR